MTAATKPTYEQAQLHLQVYDLRREAKLRVAREWFFKNYFPNSFEEGMKIAAPGTENGAYFMQVISYWENACALLNYGCCTKICSSPRAVNFSPYGTALSLK